MSETYAPAYAGHETRVEEDRLEESTATTTRVITWVVIALAVVLLIAATVFLVMGVMALIAVVSPILVAGMLAWLVFLSVRLLRLEKRLADAEMKRSV